MTYVEKLKDPRWQKKRLEILSADNWTCQNCDSKEKTLHVHHKIYIKGRQPWDYSDSNFITLCDKCHEAEEKLKDNNEEFDNNMREFGIIRLKQSKFAYYMSYAYKYKPDVYEEIRKIINSKVLKSVQKAMKNG